MNQSVDLQVDDNYMGNKKHPFVNDPYEESMNELNISELDEIYPDFPESQFFPNVGIMLYNSDLEDSNLGYAFRTSIDPVFLGDSGIERIDQDFPVELNATNITTKSNSEESQADYTKNAHNTEVLNPYNHEERSIYNMENCSNVPNGEYCMNEFQQHGFIPDIQICDNILALQLSNSENKTSSITPGIEMMPCMTVNELEPDNAFYFNQKQDMHERNAILMNEQQDYESCEERKEIPISDNERSFMEKGFVTNYLLDNEIQFSEETQTSSYFALKNIHTSNDNKKDTMQDNLQITEREKIRKSFKHDCYDFSTNVNDYKSELNDIFLSKDQKYSAENGISFPGPSKYTENISVPTVIRSLNQQHKSNNRERSFPGDDPAKELQQTCNLNKDITNRIGQKRHECEICTKIFSWKSHLLRYKRIHTGEKPFICPICSKAFTEKGNRNVHARAHSGEKPFFCDICDEVFSRVFFTETCATNTRRRKVFSVWRLRKRVDKKELS